MKKILLGLMLILLVGIGGITAYWYTMDTAVLRSQLVALVSQHLGRELKISGELTPSFSLANGFGLRATGVSVGNARGFSPAQMLQVDSLELAINPFALINHQLDIRTIAISGVDAYLESRGSVNNWTFADKAGAAPSPTEQRVPAKPMTVSINRIAADGVKMTMISNGQKKVYKIQSLQASAQAGQPVTLKVEAEADGQRMLADITAGTLEQINSGQQQPLKLSLEYGPQRVALAANYRRNGDAHMLSGMKLDYNDIQAMGDMSVAIGGPVPSVTFDLTVPQLDIAKLQSADSSSVTATSSANAGGVQPLFSRDPLPWDALNTANLNGKLAVGQLRNGSKDLGPLDVQIALKAGGLMANVVMQPPGAAEPITTRVNANANKTITIAARAPKLEPSLLFGWMGSEPLVQAPAKFLLDLTGSGDSMHNVMSAANGQMLLEFMPGTLNVKALPMAVEGALASLVGLDQLQGARLACAKVDFGIMNGIAKARGIGIDSGPLITAGEGDINLGAETINLRVVAEPRVAVAAGTRIPVYIKGALNAPTTFADTAAITGQVANAAAGKAIKLIGDEKVAALADQLLGTSKQAMAQKYVVMPFNPCRPNDVDKGPEPAQPKASPVTEPRTAVPPQQQIQEIVKDPKKLLQGLFGQ
jgi:uncharacterized protein involved in outer membrane biogenesis